MTLLFATFCFSYCKHLGLVTSKNVQEASNEEDRCVEVRWSEARVKLDGVMIDGVRIDGVSDVLWILHIEGSDASTWK